MSARPNIFARIQLWLKRFRHRCGYGIHSPYAFNLVTQVIYQRGEYYAYASLADARENAHLCEKDDRLLLRLANDWRPRTCWLIGPETDVSAAYLRAGCEACTLRQMRSLEEVAAAEEPAEMIVVDDDAMGPAAVAALVPKLLTGRHLLVALRVGENTKMAAEWQKIFDPNSEMPSGTSEEENLSPVTCLLSLNFDLYYMGLAYFGTGLSGQSYVINYI